MNKITNAFYESPQASLLLDIQKALARCKEIAATQALDACGAVVSSVSTKSSYANDTSFRIAGAPVKATGKVANATFWTHTATKAISLLNQVALCVDGSAAAVVANGRMAPQAGLVTLADVPATACPIAKLDLSHANKFVGGTTAVTGGSGYVYADVVSRAQLAPQLPVAYNRFPEHATGTAYVVGDKVSGRATGTVLDATTTLQYFQCTVAGTSHASTEPAWAALGSTVAEGTGTCVWKTCSADLANVKLAATAAYTIKGAAYTRGSGNNIFNLTGFNCSKSNTNKAWLCLDAAGTAHVLAGTQAATAAAVQPPVIDDALAVIAILKVACGTVTAFTGGTSLLGHDADCVATFIDPVDEVFVY